MDSARREVQTLRRGAVDREQLLAARSVLLKALECLACELKAQQIPVPPWLRDDLRLQRRVHRAALTSPRAARALRQQV